MASKQDQLRTEHGEHVQIKHHVPGSRMSVIMLLQHKKCLPEVRFLNDRILFHKLSQCLLKEVPVVTTTYRKLRSANEKWRVTSKLEVTASSGDLPQSFSVHYKKPASTATIMKYEKFLQHVVPQL